MKYCTKCGKELVDDAAICLGCGSLVEGTSVSTTTAATAQPQAPVTPSGLSVVAKVFMIIGTIAMALSTCGVGLAWCLPMTLSYVRNTRAGIPVSTGFKVCSLLFVSTVAGILMLCDHND